MEKNHRLEKTIKKNQLLAKGVNSLNVGAKFLKIRQKKLVLSFQNKKANAKFLKQCKKIFIRFSKQENTIFCKDRKNTKPKYNF